MGNLSLIFGGFDGLLTKYELITKIKLIGDVYMCGAGLFAPTEPPERHAEQTVRFGLEALRVLDEMNVKLNATLSVRIGINTGGPIIAGVLGTDKPVFDIIGDPINIAARLQSTDVPGKVQISEDTYALVKDHGFSIEPRGEVFLKGKGNRPAFLVSPTMGFFSAISPQSSLFLSRRSSTANSSRPA
jgi:class 3 adenylate cyclase